MELQEECLIGRGELEERLREEEVTSRRPLCLRARCMPLFIMPSKGATQDPFEVPDHAAGCLKTCRR